jgi:GAF domain-containing protein/HAMP domain-containing protein
MTATGKRTSPFRNSFKKTRGSGTNSEETVQAPVFIKSRSLRRRLIVTFILLALLPVVITSTAVGILVTENGQQQVIQQLEAVSALKESKIDAWLLEIQHNLEMITTIHEQPEHFWMIEQLVKSDPSPGSEHAGVQQEMLGRFQENLEESGAFEEIFLINTDGKVILSTNRNLEGKDKSSQVYFKNGVEQIYLSPAYRSEDLDRITMVAASPIRNSNHETVAVVAGRVNLALLNEIMLQQAGLGETGEIYLITENHIILTPTRFEVSSPRETYFYSETARQVLEEKSSGSGLYNGYRGIPIIGVYRWLPELQMALLIEQYQSEALKTTYATLVAHTVTAVGAVFFAVLIALAASRSITRPIRKLAETAEQIATGNLSMTAKVEQADEIGALAFAFNSMTFQLRNLIGALEERVAERTRELEKRSSQQRIAAQVARDASRVRDLDELLQKAALLVRDRFGYQQVSFFLMDERGENAILKTTTGEAGQQMLEEGYRYKSDESSVVGYAILHGRAKVSTTGEPEIALPNHPFLPNSYSEAALPLKVGERVTGALNLHSSKGNDFDSESIEVLQTMADQLAVAIENIRLLREMQKTVLELESAYGHYTQETWQSFFQRTGRVRGLRYRGLQPEPAMRLSAQAVEAIRDQKSILSDGEIGLHSQIKHSSLAIPMKLRGKALGILNIEFEGHQPAPEAVAFYEEVTERLALALDNVRLLEETKLRSEQLKLLQEITAAAASHVNLENLFEDVTARMRSGFEVEHCGVILFDPGEYSGSLVSSASSQTVSPIHHLLGTHIPLESVPILEECIRSKKASAAYGFDKNSVDGPFRTILEALGTVTQVFVPLSARSELLGIIMLNVVDPERRFGEDDLRLMDQISLQITTAIDVARVFEQIERRAYRERQISEITSKVRASTNVDIILQTAVQELAEALDVPRGTIQLHHANGGSSHE